VAWGLAFLDKTIKYARIEPGPIYKTHPTPRTMLKPGIDIFNPTLFFASQCKDSFLPQTFNLQTHETFRSNLYVQPPTSCSIPFKAIPLLPDDMLAHEYRSDLSRCSTMLALKSASEIPPPVYEGARLPIITKRPLSICDGLFGTSKSKTLSYDPTQTTTCNKRRLLEVLVDDEKGVPTQTPSSKSAAIIDESAKPVTQTTPLTCNVNSSHPHRSNRKAEWWSQDFVQPLEPAKPRESKSGRKLRQVQKLDWNRGLTSRSYDKPPLLYDMDAAIKASLAESTSISTVRPTRRSESIHTLGGREIAATHVEEVEVEAEIIVSDDEVLELEAVVVVAESDSDGSRPASTMAMSTVSIVSTVRHVQKRRSKTIILVSNQPYEYDDDPVDAHDKCPICFSSLLKYRHGTTPCCAQRIHHHCIQTWLIKNKAPASCPYCRKAFSSISAKRMLT